MEEQQPNNKGIKHWAIDDRPREKLMQKGATALSDAELIAIIFSNGTKHRSAVDLARDLLRTAEHDLNRLARMTLIDFQKINGIGPAKAVALMACLELGRRRKSITVKEESHILSSKTAFEIIYPKLQDLVNEVFYVIYMNQNNKVVSQGKISEGGITGTVVDTRILIKNALDHRATSIIVAHNHPSHSLKPSNADITITTQIKEAAALFNIRLFDHIIIGGNSYFSFADEGLL